MARRSIPGQGSMCGIYLASPGISGDCIVDPNSDNKTILSSVGEDYADCSFGVVVKVKPEVTQAELADHLRRIADAVEKGFYPIWQDVDPNQEPPWEQFSVWEGKDE